MDEVRNVGDRSVELAVDTSAESVEDPGAVSGSEGQDRADAPAPRDAAEAPRRRRRRQRQDPALPAARLNAEARQERDRETIRAMRRADAALGRALSAIRRDVLAIGRRSAGDIFTLGRAFERARECLPKLYETWVRFECGVDPATTRNYRRVVERLAAHEALVTKQAVAPTVLVRLASKPDLVEPAIAAIAAGHRLRVADLRNLVPVDLVAPRPDNGPRAAKPVSLAPKAIAAMVTAAEREVADILARADRQDATDEALEDQALRLAGRLDGLAAFLEGEEDQKRWSRLAGLLREAVTASPKDVWSVRSDAKAALKRAASFTGSAIVEPERLQPALIRTSPSGLKTFEIFAGAGGLAEGFRQAGFAHVGLAEWNADACATLRANFRGVTVHEGDVARLLDADLPRVDVLAGGPPCQPFSIGSNSQGGEFDDRNKFPISLELVKHIRPRAVVFENVSGIFTEKNARFRTDLVDGLERAGYAVTWEELDAQDYGVPQRRKRSFLVAFSDPGLLANFRWPAPRGGCCTVAKTLEPLLRECGWTPPPGFLEGLQTVAPTIVGGSDLKDGVDLGHKMVRKWWANRGVVATRFAAKAPGPDHMGPVVPTLAMLAALQGFPPDWIWCGSRLEVFRQIGNAVCPPLGATIAAAVRLALTGEESTPPFILRPFGGVMAYMAAKYGHEAIWAAEQEERDLAWRIPAE